MRTIGKFTVLLCVVVSSLFALPLSVVGQAQASAAQAIKIKAKIEKIGVRADITVKLATGQTYHGFVARIDDQVFEITEVDLKTNLTIRYEEVKKVESGYGEKGPLGNRVGKKGRRIGMIIGITVAVIIPAIIAATVKDR